MPGRKRKYTVYNSEEELKVEEALKWWKSKAKNTIRASAAKFEVDVNKIKRAKNQNSGKPGRKPALPAKFEEKLVEALCIVADWSFPLTTHDVRSFVKSMLDKWSYHQAIHRQQTRRMVDEAVRQTA